MAYKTSIAIIIILSALQSCKRTTRSDYAIFRYNESKGIPTLDPAMARNQTIIWVTSNIFNGLVQFNSALQTEPSIAKSWEIDTTHLLYTFYIRSNVLYHEHEIFGKQRTRAVTASDFVYSFNRLLAPETGSAGAWVFANTDRQFGSNGFKALNDTTLQIKLQKPFAPFINMLAMPYCVVVPHEVIETTGDKFGQHPIGTGPFKLSLWDLNNRLILRRNDRYFERDSAGTPLPYLDAIHISFIADKQSEFMEFLLGNIDFISGINSTNKDELLTRDGQLREKHKQRFYLQTTPYLNTEYLGFNMDSTQSGFIPHAIRQAINYSIDRHRMTAFLRNNLAIPADLSIIPPILHPRTTNLPEANIYAPHKAIEILKKAGYGTEKRVPPIILTTTPDYIDIAEFIQNQVKQIGIDITIETATGAAFRQKVSNGELPFFRASWIADYPHAENYLLLFSTQNITPAGPNYTKFSDTNFDSLYSQISANQLQNDLIRQADSIVTDKTPVIPLFYDVVVRFVNKRVSNLPVNALNMINLKYTKIDNNTNSKQSCKQ